MITDKMIKAGRHALFRHYGTPDLRAMADQCVIDIYEAMAHEKLKQGLTAYWSQVADDELISKR